ncbi:MAG: hypothetical protein HDR51_03260 [Treponema sp.]|nr:hypothetical protein [Treponema sp.]
MEVQADLLGKEFFMLGSLVIGIVGVIIFIPIIIATARAIRKRSLQNSLLEAVRNHDKESVQKLIAKGASVNNRNNHGRYPLETAVESDDKEMVLFLIEKGADVDNGVQYPLVIAVKKGNKDIVSVLIEKGAKVNFYYTKPLDYAKDEEIITLLRSHGAITQKEQDEADVDFVNAVRCHDTERVKQLIPKISDIDIIPARVYNNPNMPKDVFELVIQSYNQNTDKVEEYKQKNVTPLIYAAARGDIETVKLLVENGANVNARTSYGVTALTWGAIVIISDVDLEHTVELIDFLASKGANVNEKYFNELDSDMTALMSATAAGSIEIVRALIRNGADVNAESGKGATALLAAKIRGYKDIAILLRESGAWH